MRINGIKYNYRVQRQCSAHSIYDFIAVIILEMLKGDYKSTITISLVMYGDRKKIL